MSKFVILVWASCVTLGMSMFGGQVLEKKFPYFVHIISSQDNDPRKIASSRLDPDWSLVCRLTRTDINDGHLGENGTTPVPTPKWLYCAGILIEPLTVLTADDCNVGVDGHHFIAGVGAEMNQIHPVKAVIRGRHLLDFEVVTVSNSTVDVWAPVGETYPLLMVNLDEAELNKLALGNQTSGIVYSVAKPKKIGAMTLLSREECMLKYFELLQKFQGFTVTLPGILPSSVFCAVQAAKAFEPFPNPKRRYRRIRRDDPVTPSVPHEVTRGGNSGEDAGLLPPPIAVGAVKPGTACPDSLGSPFIIEGGQVLGILVASDCAFLHVSFFQSLTDGLPQEVNLSDRSGSWLPSVATADRWTPPLPYIKGKTLGPGGVIPGIADVQLFSLSGRIHPSMASIYSGLAYAFSTGNQLYSL